MVVDASEVKRLRWRCRRGMRELDQLLLLRLEVLLARDDGYGLVTFQRLLECEDDQLWRWCMGQQRPEDAALSSEIDALRAGHTT